MKARFFSILIILLGASWFIGCSNPFSETPKSANANLSALSVSAGSLSPAFESSITAYSVNVANAITTFTVTGTKADINASLSTNNGIPQALSVGENAITIIVTAQDGTTVKSYIVTVTREDVLPIITPSFSKNFSGTTALVLDPFVLPVGLYKITVNTTGYFQLFDVNNDETILNLSSGGAINAETFIKSIGGSYLFRTDNITESWTLSITNIDFSNPQPISDMNNVSENVPKLLGPYLLDLSTYKITMNTDGFLQLFPINSTTGLEESYIFNEFSGNYGTQNIYKPSVKIILFRTDNITSQYGFSIVKL